MALRVVLIDYENVRPESLAPVAASGARIVVFVGASQSKIPFGFADSMQRLGDRASYLRCAGNGPNALDFHIACHIGEQITSAPGVRIVVVSKDAGYDPLLQHLKDRGMAVSRCASIDDVHAVESQNALAPTECAEQFMLRLRRPKATRPGTERALFSSIRAQFRARLVNEDPAPVVALLCDEGHVSIDAGKVSYPSLD